MITVMMALGMFAGQSSSSTPELDAYSGGFWGAYEFERQRRAKARRKRLEEEEEIERLQEVDREIARLLRAQEEADEKRREIERLSSIVAQFADREAKDAFNERVADAYAAYRAKLTIAALEKFERELQRQLEDEEYAVLQLLLED